MSSELPKFDLHFATDKSLPFVLDVNSENLTLHPPPKSMPKSIGSKKRKRSTFEGHKPEKFDGKQFCTAFLQGNETKEEIAAMKAKSSLNQIDDSFYEEQTKFCENYLKDFIKNCKDARAAEMKQRSREAATRLYEAVEFEDLPLDVPQVAAEQIMNRSKNGFEKHGYHPAEEIFQAVGTSRLGINDLDPPGQRNFVDDIYVPYLYSFWTNDIDEEISVPEISASSNQTLVEPTTEEKEESEEEFETLPSSSSLKRRRQTSESANL
uniref:Uncharacterized protein n=1 Tax=Panagrolaimus sp. ES5 TaxID=591445 RepID=A0AC34FN35_9BILA